jgi:LAO/AO transport system kinase
MITMVESSLDEDRAKTSAVVSSILADRAKAERKGKIEAFRVGLSGSPGVGKSTFIEAFGMMLIAKGYKVAVLAVDPSSVRKGGSILGDKTRMVELSKSANAYIRPSPSRGTLGGVTKNTNETILILEEAGYDLILVETVGVGQSEVAVESMVDMFTLLANPVAGDELQGIKRGIVELSDLIVVNKADGDLIPKARQAQFEYLSALRYATPKSPRWRPRVLACSSLSGSGLEEVWDTMYDFWKSLEESGDLPNRRQQQRVDWMWRLVHDELDHQLHTSPHLQALLPDLIDSVKAGSLPPGPASTVILTKLFQSPYKPSL